MQRGRDDGAGVEYFVEAEPTLGRVGALDPVHNGSE